MYLKNDINHKIQVKILYIGRMLSKLKLIFLLLKINSIKSKRVEWKGQNKRIFVDKLTANLN